MCWWERAPKNQQSAPFEPTKASAATLSIGSPSSNGANLLSDFAERQVIAFGLSSQLFICGAHSPSGEKNARPKDSLCGNKNGSRRVLRRNAPLMVSPEFWRIYGERVSASQIWYVNKKIVSAAFCCVYDFFMYANPHECSPRPECKCTTRGTLRDGFLRYIRLHTHRRLQTCPILLPIFFYYFLLPAHKKMLSRSAFFAVVCYSPVCFIRTFGPRIFNQSAKGFLFFLSLYLGPRECFFFFARISQALCGTYLFA